VRVAHWQVQRRIRSDKVPRVHNPADNDDARAWQPMLREFSSTASDSVLSNTRPRRDDRKE